jgi:chorismate dehydratase
MIDRIRDPARDGDGSRPRIGAVSYLNSKPLIEGLPELAPGADLILDIPSRLADSLAAGRIDIGLIPSIELFSDPDYEIVSDACVATRGPVRSVKLFFRVPPGDVASLAIDEGSRTSVVLGRIMLAERYGVFPSLHSLALERSINDIQADAILLIGDRAMRSSQEPFHTVWDLGQEWLNWTGLPFVFAMWVARRTAILHELPMLLASSRDMGLARLPEIAERESKHLGIPPSDAHDYLRDNLHFVLGPAEQSGLKLFYELALKLDLVPAHSQLKLRGDTTAETSSPMGCGSPTDLHLESGVT